MAELTYAEVARLLKYEPEAGRLFWRERPRSMFKSEHLWRLWNFRFAGKEAFTALRRGYPAGGILGRVYCAHRVAWLLFYGVWPTHEIDHIDGDKTNNRIANLRDVPKSVNLRNARMKRNNTTGATGVYWDKRSAKWQAQITVDGRQRSLGYFDEKADAVAARAATNEKHGFSARHGLAA